MATKLPNASRVHIESHTAQTHPWTSYLVGLLIGCIGCYALVLAIDTVLRLLK